MVHARRNFLMLGLLLVIIVTLTHLLMQDQRGSQVSASARMNLSTVSAVAEGADRSPFHRMRAEALFRDLTSEGDQAFQAGDLPLAQSLYEKALRLSPENDPLLSQLAQAYYRDGRVAAAIATLERRRVVSPSRVTSHTELALLMHRVGRTTEAVQILQEGLHMVPDRDAGPLYFVVALLHRDLGDREAATSMMAAAEARLAAEEIRLAKRMWEAQTTAQLKAALTDEQAPERGQGAE